MNVVLVLSSFGGIAAFLSAVVIVVRAIFKQVGATEDNTKALHELSDKFEKQSQIVNGHENRIGRLEERTRGL